MTVTENLVETLTKCVHSKPPFEDDAQKVVCQRMVDGLPSDDLVHVAACTSYAYWHLAQNPETCPDPSVRNDMALREARRHLSHMNGDAERAAEHFLECVQYRKEHRLDLLRTCFSSSIAPANEEDKRRSQDMASLIRKDMDRQHAIMRTRDQHRRAVMIKFPRYEAGTTDESYIWSQVYMAERSAAVTEVSSLGTHDRTVSIFDYHGFESSKSPPAATQIKAATLLQKFYPERLQTLVILDPPFWLRGILALLRPVISTSIMSRIIMATGPEETSEALSDIVSPDDMSLLLLPNNRLNTAISMDHFLLDVPFYALYDDVECKREIPEPRQTPAKTTESTVQSLTGTASTYLKSFW